ncbi:hypothetical protein [Catenulispora pinisilvae]|nr:hypothetical protein [Catenulispora pinisilvae]
MGQGQRNYVDLAAWAVSVVGALTTTAQVSSARSIGSGKGNGIR